MKPLKILCFFLAGCLLGGCASAGAAETGAATETIAPELLPTFTVGAHPLDSLLTQSYSAQSLQDYFTPYHQNVLQPGSTVQRSEVEAVFPIELTREEGYSIYKVQEGGYYYVFWDGVTVYTSLWLQDQWKDEDMSWVQPGVHSAKQFSTDPSFELCIGASEICSYTYMGNATLRRITYEVTGRSLPTLSDLTVLEVTTVPRTEASCRLATILPQDLP